METINHGDNGGGVTRQMWDRMATDVDANFAEHTADLAQKVVKTVKFTIGHPASTTADFVFADDANTTEQVVDLGAIIPAKARVIDIFSFTDSAWTFSGGATTLVAETGSSSSGNQYIASATIYAANAITSIAAGAQYIAAPSASAGHVYVAATPGANWSTITAGQTSYYISYIDVTDL